MNYFKSFNREKSTQDEKKSFIKGKELKVTQVQLFPSLFLRFLYADFLVLFHYTGAGDKVANNDAFND